MASWVTRCWSPASVAGVARPEPDVPEAPLVRAERRLPVARPHFVRDLAGQARLFGEVGTRPEASPVAIISLPPSTELPAAATTPVQRLGVFLAHLTPPCQPSPEGLPGRPAHRPFRGLLGVHSRCGLHTRAVTNS